MLAANFGMKFQLWWNVQSERKQVLHQMNYICLLRLKIIQSFFAEILGDTEFIFKLLSKRLTIHNTGLKYVSINNVSFLYTGL